MADHDHAPTATDALGAARREEVLRRYWMKGDLTPLAVANALAASREKTIVGHALVM